MGGTTRRDMLKKTAVAGAIVWTVPTLTASPAFAAGSLSTNLCDQGKTPNSITYQWNARGTTFSVCTETGPGQPTNPNVEAEGDSTGWTHAIVTAHRLTGPNTTALPVAPSFIAFGGQFTITGALAPNSRVTLTRANADETAFVPAATQTMTYHFSCSQPLCFNDQHGPLKVVSYTVS